MIGYNPTKINEMIIDIEASYKSLRETLSTGWTTASKVMNANWIGVDERDYEGQLAKRLRSLYEETGEIVVNAMNNVANVGNGWIKFQKENKMKGGEELKGLEVVGAAKGPSEFSLHDSADFEKLTLPVAKDDFTGDKFGIKAGGGAKIKSTLKEYSDNVQSKMKNIYKKIDSGSAFLGENQSKKIEDYLAHVGELMGKLATAFGDIYKMIDKLTASSGAGAYEEADKTIASKFTKTIAKEDKKNKFNSVE